MRTARPPLAGRFRCLHCPQTPQRTLTRPGQRNCTSECLASPYLSLQLLLFSPGVGVFCFRVFSQCTDKYDSAGCAVSTDGTACSGCVVNSLQSNEGLS